MLHNLNFCYLNIFRTGSQKQGSRAELVCMISPDVSEGSKLSLQMAFDRTILIDVINSNEGQLLLINYFISRDGHRAGFSGFRDWVEKFEFRGPGWAIFWLQFPGPDRFKPQKQLMVGETTKVLFKKHSEFFPWSFFKKSRQKISKNPWIFEKCKKILKMKIISGHCFRFFDLGLFVKNVLKSWGFLSPEILSPGFRDRKFFSRSLALIQARSGLEIPARQGIFKFFP